MEPATLAGSVIVDGALSIPYSGNWTLRAVVDAPPGTRFSGGLEAVWQGLRFRGTAASCGTLGGAVVVTMAGGCGRLASRPRPAGYRDTTLGIVLDDLVRGCGELVADGISEDVRNVELPYYAVLGFGSTARALTVLCDGIGAVWRVTPGGRIWVGADSGKDIGVAEAGAGSVDPVNGAYTIQVPSIATIAPGRGFRGHAIQRVEHRVSKDGFFSTLYTR